MSKLVNIYYGQVTDGASFELLAQTKIDFVDLFVKAYFKKYFDSDVYKFELIHACNAPELQLYMITRDGLHFSTIFIPLLDVPK